MLDVLDKLDQWRQDNEPLAIATVVETWGSAPRPVGSKMVITRSGGIAGSVSAGCVEGAVIEESAAVIHSGTPRLVEFGVADETAWEVGLACGGKIKVLIEPGFSFDLIYDSLKNNLIEKKPFLTLNYLQGMDEHMNRKLLVEPGGQQVGDLELPNGGDEVLKQALEMLDNEKGGTIQALNGAILFVEVHPQPPKLIIIGAVHLSEPLITIANTLGFETILIDPREAFASRERYPHADQLVQTWPDVALQEYQLDKSAYIVVLTHDPKLDDPALITALSSDARYVGALGSKRTNKKRMERLRSAGLNQNQLSRLHAPIGLELGGRSSTEIAISIMAEIVQVRNSEI